MKKFAAVLLAGGQSRRMKTDKALLPHRGVPMWRFQMRKLIKLGPDQLFLSTRRELSFPTGPWTIVHDRLTERGPLGGLEAALRLTRSDLLLVLAVDMPGITAGFLRDLLDEAGPAGLAPLVEGFYCGVAAVYPVTILPLVEKVLAGEDRSFQHLIGEAIISGKMNAKEIPAAKTLLFENWNAPEDLEDDEAISPR